MPTDEPDVSPDEVEQALGSVVAAGRVRRARRRTALAGAAAVALVLSGVGVMRLTADESASNLKIADTSTTEVSVTVPDVIPGPSITATTATTPTTAAPSTATAVPGRVFVARAVDDGFDSGYDIVAVDTKNKAGRVVFHSDLPFGSISATPDGKWIYFSRESCGTGPLERVRVDGPAQGKQLEVVSEVSSIDPEVSPDGTKVAYIAMPECSFDEPQPYELRVREVNSAKEHIVAKTAGDSMGSPTWSPDGKSIAVAIARGEQVKDDPPEWGMTQAYVVVFDAAGRDQAPSKGRRVPAPRAGWGMANPQFVKNGSLFVTEEPLAGTKGVVTMALVDAETGKRQRVVATGEAGRRYSDTQADPSGNHLLYLSWPPDHEADLRMSNNGERTVVFSNRVQAVSW